jgi:methylaspartate mutase epsilon subunit
VFAVFHFPAWPFAISLEQTQKGTLMPDAAGPVVAVGGLGADSHSVGLFILTRGLAAAGFRVVDLGIQNDFDRFADVSKSCDAVLVSNMDGHCRHYLHGLASLPGTCLWYLGGHPTISGDEEDLRALGFARVYTGFVSVDAVAAALRSDLAGAAPRPRREAPALLPRSAEPTVHGRDAVLAQWPTGAAARDIEDNARVLAERASLAERQQQRGVLLQPRCGVPRVEDQGRIFEQLAAAGADVLSFQVDSLTRDGRYGDVDRVLAEGADLNGFPLVNHGVEALRELTAQCGVPVQTRHSARDPRLLAEVSLAGGVTAFEGGPVCYNIPYYAELPLEVSLERWRYVDRLVGQYAELGAVVDREFFGTLTATLVPPAVAIAINLLEARLAVEQGVRSVSLAYAEQGCRAQDVAAVRVMGRLARELLAEFGDVRTATVFHQFMGAFPQDRGDAELLISESSRTAVLAGADRILVKTSCEASRIPDATRNAEALAIVAAGARDAHSTGFVPDELEEELLEATVRALLDAVAALRPGDTAGCVAEAFRRGYLDVPFSPSKFNAGRMLACRDLSGAVRIVDRGGLPLPAEVAAFESARAGERLAAAGIPRDEAWRAVAEDVLCTARRGLTWPLDRPFPAAEEDTGGAAEYAGVRR